MSNIPEDLRYSEEHEWIRPASNHVTIGVTDHAQEQLGDVVFVELPEVGDEITRGAEFGAIESTKAYSELFAPVTGEVTEVNDSLIDAPEMLNKDPYGDGWMIRIAPAEESDIDDLMDAEAYREHIENEK